MKDRHIFRQIAPEDQQTPLINDPIMDIVVKWDNDLMDWMKWEVEDGLIHDMLWGVVDKGKRLQDLPDGKWTDYTAEQWREIREDIESLFPPIDRGGYGLNELIIIYGMMDSYDGLSTIADILNIMTDTPNRWKYVTLRGSIQRECAECIFDSYTVSDEEIRTFECWFFNTGTEWEFVDECWEIYSTHDPIYSPEQVKQDLADTTGLEPDQIILEVFDGYIKTPVYRTV